MRPHTLLFVSALASIAHAEPTTYAYDDGVSNITLGPPSSFAEFGDIDMLWGNYFFTEQATEQVTRIDFGLGRLSADTPVTVWIFEDSDDDADPLDATPIFSETVTASDMGFDFNTLLVDPVSVSGGFFVAVSHIAVLDDSNPDFPRYPSPARFDPDGRADRSWFFYDSDIPEDDLSQSGFASRMDGPFVPIPGAFAIRATTVPSPAGLALLGMSGWAIRRRRSGLVQ